MIRPKSGLDHVRQGRANTVKGRGQIYVDELDATPASVTSSAGCARFCADVGDQDVEPAVATGDVGGHRRSRLGVESVADDRFDLAASPR